MFANLSVDGWVVVPSTRGRNALRDLVADLANDPDQELSVRFTGGTGKRVFDPSQWRVDDRGTCQHALIIDDSWVSGAHSQSVASALKLAGVDEVSIFTVARVLDPRWSPSEPLVDRLRGGTFDWMRCPWTGGDCPE